MGHEFEFVVFWDVDAWRAIVPELGVSSVNETRDGAVEGLRKCLMFSRAMEKQMHPLRQPWSTYRKLACGPMCKLAESHLKNSQFMVTGAQGNKNVNYRGTVRVPDEPSACVVSVVEMVNEMVK